MVALLRGSSFCRPVGTGQSICDVWGKCLWYDKRIKKTIETFYSFQRDDGLIPYLILRSRHTIGKYFGKQAYYQNPKPVFRSHLTFGTVPDGGVLSIIATRNYVGTTGDVQFLRTYYKKMTAAFSWYETKFGYGLIWEWFSCEWADATLKIGKTLYTNILYYKAARDLSWIATRLQKTKDAARYAEIATRIGDQIRSQLWTGTHFADWIDYKRHDYLATHPNMLAIIFGFATKKEAISILKLAKQTAWNGWTLTNTNIPYPWWRIPLLHHSIGLSDYHNGLIWLQPGILFAVALYKMGKIKEAKKVLEGIDEHIKKYGDVYEVYETDGSPVKRRMYTSEHPFAWSAGLYLWACHILNGHDAKATF